MKTITEKQYSSFLKTFAYGLVLLLSIVSIASIPFSGKFIGNAAERIIYIIFSSSFIGIEVFLVSNRFSFRLLPNLAIAAAWTLLLVITESAISNACILNAKEVAEKTGKTITESDYPEVVTFIELIRDAYNNSNFDSDFIKTFLEIYSIGIFGTVFVSLATEASKSLWSDEIQNTENKTLLAKFKRARRQQILYRKIQLFDQSELLVSIVYIHLLCYLVFLLPTFVIVSELNSTDTTTLRIDIILLLISVTLEAMGIATHFIITDHALTSSEIKYLKQRGKGIQKHLHNIRVKNKSCNYSEGNPTTPTYKQKRANKNTCVNTSCKGMVLSKETKNYLQVLVHSFCNHSEVDSIEKSILFPDVEKSNGSVKGCNLCIAKNVIGRFYKTKQIYIDPNKEDYYASASSFFEPAFAIDINNFLFPTIKTVSFPKTLLDAIAIARHCFFLSQKEQWEKLLYPVGKSFVEISSILILDYIYRRFSERNQIYNPCNIDCCKEDHSAEYGAALLEFPYVMETYLLDRFKDNEQFVSKDTLKKGNDWPRFSERVELSFSERVEQYYWELFKNRVNCLERDTCYELGNLFASFLTDSYKNEERFLRRILPVNRENYRLTSDKPDGSIKLSKKRTVEIAIDSLNIEKQQLSMIPGWSNVFKKAWKIGDEVSSKYNNPEEKREHVEKQLFGTDRNGIFNRLTRYDNEYIGKREIDRCDGCCLDITEKSTVLSWIIFCK